MQQQEQDTSQGTGIPRIDLNIVTLAPSKVIGDSERSCAQEKYSCACSMCKVSINAIKKRKKIFPYESNPFARVFKASPPDCGANEEKDFVFVLKHLMPPSTVERSLRLMIPETAVFVGSEIRTIAYTDKDRVLKFIKQKEKLTLSELSIFMMKQAEKVVRPSKESSPNNKLTGTPIRSGQFTPSVSLFSYPTSPMFYKTALPEDNFQAMNDEDSANFKEIALLKLKDGNVRVLTQTELKMVFQKSKTDKFWKNIQYMQSFLRTRNSMKNSMRVYFYYDEEKSKPLFQKSMKEILYLNGDLAKASEEYIPVAEEEAFEFSLKQKNPEQYCLYLVYKIVHYLEIISRVRARKLVAEFVKDSVGVYWLMDAFKLEYQELSSKKEMQEEMAQAKEEENLQQLEELGANPKLKQKVDALGLIVRTHYEGLRTKLSLNDQAIERRLQEEQFSENAFAHLHPEIDFTLKDVLQNKVHPKKMQVFLENNFNNRQGLKPYSLRKLDNRSFGTSKDQAGGQNINSSTNKKNLSLLLSMDTPISETKEPKNKSPLLRSSISAAKLKTVLTYPNNSSLNLRYQDPKVFDVKTPLKEKRSFSMKGTGTELQSPTFSTKSQPAEAILAHRASDSVFKRPNTHSGKRLSYTPLSMKEVGLVLKKSPLHHNRTKSQTSQAQNTEELPVYLKFDFTAQVDPSSAFGYSQSRNISKNILRNVFNEYPVQ